MKTGAYPEKVSYGIDPADRQLYNRTYYRGSWMVRSFICKIFSKTAEKSAPDKRVTHFSQRFLIYVGGAWSDRITSNNDVCAASR